MLLLGVPGSCQSYICRSLPSHSESPGCKRSEAFTVLLSGIAMLQLIESLLAICLDLMPEVFGPPLPKFSTLLQKEEAGGGLAHPGTINMSIMTGSLRSIDV